MRIDVNIEEDGHDDWPELVLKERIYLPSVEAGVEPKEYLSRYIVREFPEPENGGTAIYSVPNAFQQSGERQASLAEETVFARLKNLNFHQANGKKIEDQQQLWAIFFHSACYAGHSYRNQRVGKLIMREHDFVLFVKYQGKFFVILMEVKSTNDLNTNITQFNLEKCSDAKVIKNNKRSAQHQLRDHLEVLQGVLCENPTVLGHAKTSRIQTFIMWPFLGAYTKNPRQQVIRRWNEENDLHVFEDVLSDQKKFDEWFFQSVLGSNCDLKEDHFNILLNRFITLSCGVFVNEINEGMMALLTQEQVQLLNSNVCSQPRNNNGSGGGGPKALVIHGAAGTGKTLLVLRKLQQLHQNGQLDGQNRALYICYWPGIRREMELKLEALGIRQFVDTARYYISLTGFLETCALKYKHIFMDEAEALCLAFDQRIVTNTLGTIYRLYQEGNCQMSAEQCPLLENIQDQNDDFLELLSKNHNNNNSTSANRSWGQLWFAVDINQASMFLPKHSPNMLKTPCIILSKVMRTTGYIFDLFKEFYTFPMPTLPKSIAANVRIPCITLGHHVQGPPVYWMDSRDRLDEAIAYVIVDLCSTKGFKANDLCVLPFLLNDKMRPEVINSHIDRLFVENGFRPRAISNVEHHLERRELNDFLVPWVLKVKGLEFKCVIMAIDDDDFDFEDSEDRKKAYIMASRCTSMLIIISNLSTKSDMDWGRNFRDYPFGLDFGDEWSVK